MLALAFVAVVTVAIGAATQVRPEIRTILCDGSVPARLMPADYADGDCVEMPPGWEATLPWDEDDDLVCLGLCLVTPTAR